MADQKAIQQLDLNLLRVFESLYQEQNMTRTAEALHLTPSAVSHAIKRLRQALDDPLFQRSRNRMLPTPACQRMAPLIIDNLTRLRQILQQWGQFDPATSRHHFRIGMHYAFELSLLPLLAEALSHKAPTVTFSSVKFERQHISRDLAAGHLDLVLDVGLPVKTPIRHQKLFDDGFCVLQAKAGASALNQQAYLARRHIVVSNRPSGPSVDDWIFREQGVNRQIAVRCQNYHAARAMVVSSDCLLTLPRSVAMGLLADDLVMSDVPYTMPPVSTHLYWHENTEQDAALSWLRELLLAQLIR